MDKLLLKKSGGVLARAIFATFMALIVHISFIFIGEAALTHAVGYSVYILNEETNQQELLYTHYYADSEEDTRLAELDANETPYLKYKETTELSTLEKGIIATVSQLFCIGIIISFIYIFVWHIGNKDLNAVKFERMQFDKYKGLKIGLIASIPFDFVYLLLLLGALNILPGSIIFVYRLAFGFVYPITSLIIGSPLLANELSVVQLLLLSLMMLIIPLICHFSYIIGYKDISIKNKLVYKEG